MKNLSLILIGLLFLVACGTSELRKIEPQKAGEVEVKEFRDAENSYKNKKTALAIKKFTAFIQRHPEIDLTNDSYFYLGQIYFEQNDFFKAAKNWLAVVESKLANHYFNRSVVGAAQSMAQLGRNEEALKILERFNRTPDTDKVLTEQELELSAKLKLQRGDPLGAVQDLLAASDFKPAQVDKQVLFNRAVEVVNGNLTAAQLSEIAGSNQYRGLDLIASFRLGTLYYEQKNWGSARGQLQTVVQKYPGTDQASHAQQYLMVIEAQERTDGAAVGVILPLSGKYGQMGYKTLRGIQMGLGLFKKSGGLPVKLAIIDSEGNPDVARRGVERLVSEDHVVAIIGDIVSKTAQAVSTKAQELGVPNLTLSQKIGLSDIGDFVFRSILTPENQMKSLVDIAMDQKGLKNFAIVYSNDSYGTDYATTFWDYVLSKGGQVTAVQSYQPEETDFRDAVQRLVGTYFGAEDRSHELQLRLAEWKKEQAQKNSHEKPPKDLLPPIVDFDALFIPDGPKAIGQLAPMLAYNDVSNMILLGTNIWNTPQTIVRGGKFVENSIFIDDFFSEDTSAAMKKFSADFQSQFNYKPDVFEAHGFDVAVLTAKVLQITNFSGSRISFRDHLIFASNVEGAAGLIKMSPKREIEKTLVPLTILKGQIVKFDTSANAKQ